MNESEFYAMAKGDQFERDGKQYTVVTIDGPHVIAHPQSNPSFLVHFLPHQASQLYQTERKPDAPSRPKSSHGFPLLERATPHLPAPHMPGTSKTGICIALDGGLAECRIGNEIGSPLPGSVEFLNNATASGIDVQIITHRPQHNVWQWLRVHFPGMEHVIHVSHSPPTPGVLYLSRYARRIEDTYPSLEDILAGLLQPSNDGGVGGDCGGSSSDSSPG
jgi:hypothetical protein